MSRTSRTKYIMGIINTLQLVIENYYWHLLTNELKQKLKKTMLLATLENNIFYLQNWQVFFVKNHDKTYMCIYYLFLNLRCKWIYFSVLHIVWLYSSNIVDLHLCPIPIGLYSIQLTYVNLKTNFFFIQIRFIENKQINKYSEISSNWHLWIKTI